MFDAPDFPALEHGKVEICCYGRNRNTVVFGRPMDDGPTQPFPRVTGQRANLMRGRGRQVSCRWPSGSAIRPNRGPLERVFASRTE